MSIFHILDKGGGSFSYWIDWFISYNTSFSKPFKIFSEAQSNNNSKTPNRDFRSIEQNKETLVNGRDPPLDLLKSREATNLTKNPYFDLRTLAALWFAYQITFKPTTPTPGLDSSCEVQSNKSDSLNPKLTVDSEPRKQIFVNLRDYPVDSFKTREGTNLIKSPYHCVSKLMRVSLISPTCV
jgi:hypothetical protein